MQYVLDGTTYNVEVTRKNNKNLYIRVREDLTISVTCNRLVKDKEIISILDRNHRALHRMINSRVKEREKNERFYLFGHIYDIIIVSGIDGIDIVENYIYVSDKNKLSCWLSKEIDRIFSERYEYWFNNFSEEIPYYRLRYRKMKTRWGVCNKKSKTITLNLNLFKYDLECLDYVIVHELSHLIHFDHSKEFWQLVEKNFPEYKRVRKMLK